MAEAKSLVPKTMDKVATERKKSLWKNSKILANRWKKTKAYRREITSENDNKINILCTFH
jgi:hypothetical protein